MATKPPAIISLEEAPSSVNMCIYSDPGVGKTVLAGTGKVLFLATEPGTLSAQVQGSKADLWECYEAEALFSAIKWVLANPDHGYDWIVIDSVTEMQRILMKNIMANVVLENSRRDPDLPSMQEWQKYYGQFQRMIEQLNASPSNILYLATAMHAEDEEGEDLLLPMLAGKLGTKDSSAMSRWLSAGMTCIGYLEKVTAKKSGTTSDKWRVLWQAEAPITAKDRTDALGTWMATYEEGEWKNTMSTILRKIEAKTSSPKAATPVKAVPKKTAPPRRAVAR